MCRQLLTAHSFKRPIVGRWGSNGNAARLGVKPPILLETGASNVAVSLCAFSYSGTIFLAVTADAASFPDVDMLVVAMERTWQELANTQLRRSREQLRGSVRSRESTLRTATSKEV